MKLVNALQDYNTLEDNIRRWHIIVNDFISEQEYSIEDYADFCNEAQFIWPINTAISRQYFIADLIVKPVPFTHDVYYAMCTYPNYRVISSNIQIPLPAVDSAMMFRDENNAEMSSVIFFNNVSDVRKYYHDILNIGEIAFYVMACYFFSYKDLSKLNIRKFKQISQSQRSRINNRFMNSCYNYAIDYVMIGALDLTQQDNDDKLPDAKINKILMDCLKHFEKSKNFIRRCC